MSTQQKRQYVSKTRSQAADATKARVLRAARALFVRHGIDRTTVAQVAAKARVSVPTVYALYKSKEGILREMARTVSASSPGGSESLSISVTKPWR